MLNEFSKIYLASLHNAICRPTVSDERAVKLIRSLADGLAGNGLISNVCYRVILHYAEVTEASRCRKKYPDIIRLIAADFVFSEYLRSHRIHDDDITDAFYDVLYSGEYSMPCNVFMKDMGLRDSRSFCFAKDKTILVTEFCEDGPDEVVMTKVSIINGPDKIDIFEDDDVSTRERPVYCEKGNCVFIRTFTNAHYVIDVGTGEYFKREGTFIGISKSGQPAVYNLGKAYEDERTKETGFYIGRDNMPYRFDYERQLPAVNINTGIAKLYRDYEKARAVYYQWLGIGQCVRSTCRYVDIWPEVFSLEKRCNAEEMRKMACGIIEQENMNIPGNKKIAMLKNAISELTSNENRRTNDSELFEALMSLKAANLLDRESELNKDEGCEIMLRVIKEEHDNIPAEFGICRTLSAVYEMICEEENLFWKPFTGEGALLTDHIYIAGDRKLEYKKVAFVFVHAGINYVVYACDEGEEETKLSAMRFDQDSHTVIPGDLDDLEWEAVAGAVEEVRQLYKHE